MYLRTRVWVIVLLALNSAAYAAMADLGGMAAENVRYAALLSTVCVLAVGVCDFLRCFRRSAGMRALLRRICRTAARTRWNTIIRRSSARWRRTGRRPSRGWTGKWPI